MLTAGEVVGDRCEWGRSNGSPPPTPNFVSSASQTTVFAVWCLVRSNSVRDYLVSSPFQVPFCGPVHCMLSITAISRASEILRSVQPQGLGKFSN